MIKIETMLALMAAREWVRVFEGDATGVDWAAHAPVAGLGDPHSNPEEVSDIRAAQDHIERDVIRVNER